MNCADGHAVELKNVSVQFPGVLANDKVSLCVKRGEVLALVGENGAGKSTLMNVLYGILPPTDGEVFIKGERIRRFSPKEAISRGVGMVHQHFMLVPSFTVAENIVLSREPRKMGVFFDGRAAVSRTRALIAEYGLNVDPQARVSDLSVGLQQRVEILKTLYRGADILILDEPTAVLTPQETEELFSVIRRVAREKAMTVIVITHKLYEVTAISDRVGVMRQGRLVGLEETKNVTERSLASLMVGRDVLFGELEKTGEPGEVALEARGLRVANDRGLSAVRGVNLSVRAGEIVGIAAVEGNGQSELFEAVTGLRKPQSGKVLLRGADVTGLDPGAIRRAGLSHIPEDRLKTGVSREADVVENLMVGKHRKREFAAGGEHFKRMSIARYAEEVYHRFDIRAAGIHTKAGSLSGGNIQKLVAAREFSFETPVLAISQPTRGVDIGAMEFIHKLILHKRNEGAAILLSSADLDEVFRLSDRIVTLFEGEITGEFAAGHFDKAEIGYRMMVGGREAAHDGETAR
ncbi:MAG: ABC transporter ATP-binding protein [Clostridiaceae bacterium]|nr:ABC transporter ATP-binding protein [Eubacteriales bacterium]